MSATLIAVALALLLGHLLPKLPAVRSYDWFVAWLRWFTPHLADGSRWQARLGWAMAVGLPVIAVALVQWGLHDRWYHLPAFFFSLLVLVYVWGPRDLDLDVEAVIEARDPALRREAAQPLFPDGREPTCEGPALVEAVFRAALWRWFGVLFWFALCGAAGAIAYRLVALSAQGQARRSLPESQHPVAAKALAVLDWPAAHLMSFGLALAADFDRVFGAWREWYANGFRLGLGFLDASARASVAFELAEEEAYAVDGPAQGPALLELRDAMSLVWRVLLLWLGLIALFVLAGFVN
jgi:AmpE protein